MDAKRKTRSPKVVHVAGYVMLWMVLGLGLWWILAGAESPDPSTRLYQILFVVAVCVGLLVFTCRFIVRSRLRPPQLNVLNARPCLGERLTFDVRLNARRSMTVRKVVAVLSCTEEVRRARRHERILPVVVSRLELTLARKTRLDPDEPKDIPGEIVVPADGMQSFESHLCAVRWRLDVLVFVGRHATYHEREVLSVQPIRLASAEEGE